MKSNRLGDSLLEPRLDDKVETGARGRSGWEPEQNTLR